MNSPTCLGPDWTTVHPGLSRSSEPTWSAIQNTDGGFNQFWTTMYTDRGFPRSRSNYDRSRRYFVKLGWIKIDPPIYGSRSREPWIPAVRQNNKRSFILCPKQCEVSHFLSKPSESSNCFAQIGGSSLINFSQFGNFMEDS